MKLIRWLRAPVPTGGLRALLVVIIVAVAVLAIPPFLPVSPGWRDRLMLSGIGVWSVAFGLLRPRLLWDAGALADGRGMLGDRGTALFYIVFGLVFFGFMWAAPLPFGD